MRRLSKPFKSNLHSPLIRGRTERADVLRQHQSPFSDPSFRQKNSAFDLRRSAPTKIGVKPLRRHPNPLTPRPRQRVQVNKITPAGVEWVIEVAPCARGAR
jgi:hypothetical protein